jgi:hypothetical protein
MTATILPPVQASTISFHADHQIIGEQDRERLVADEMASAPDRMAEAKRSLLPGIGDLAGGRDRGLELVEQFVLAALAQGRLDLEGGVEMILDRVLGAPGHEIELVDAGGLGLFHRILDQRLVDDRQHLFRHRLGRRQKAGAEPRHREHRLAYRFWHLIPRSQPPVVGRETIAAALDKQGGAPSVAYRPSGTSPRATTSL